MKLLHRLLDVFDRWQRRTPLVGGAFAVQKKFNDDRLGQFVVALGWYGFVSIYPLLLVVTTILGFIGVASLGTSIVSTLHEFPVIGSNFNPAHPSHDLQGSTLGLVVGLLGLVYGAQGVMQSAQQAMAQAWNVPRGDRPGWLPRLARSLLGLAIIGGSFFANAAVAGFATGHGESWPLRVAVIAAMLVVNTLLFFASFRTLTPGSVATRSLLPGAAVGAVGYTLLITVGSGLIQHQVRNSSATYGQFGIVIGLVGFLFLVAKISLYGAELNPVLSRRLWPRSFVSGNPTAADAAVLDYISSEVLRSAPEGGRPPASRHDDVSAGSPSRG
jgi:uncharacterized BrkB/YihY/UPF0761 family membrane protein